MLLGRENLRSCAVEIIFLQTIHRILDRLINLLVALCSRDLSSQINNIGKCPALQLKVG